MFLFLSRLQQDIIIKACSPQVSYLLFLSDLNKI